MKIMTALVTAFMIGLGMAQLKETNLYDMVKDFQKIIQTVIKTVIIPLLPVHIAGIIANMSYVGKVFSTMAAFGKVFVLILGLQLSYVIFQYLIACQIANKNPITAIKNMLPAYFTAIGTQSSAATIPVTLKSARKNKINEDIADFVIPLGATVHLAGSTITLTTCAVAVALIQGIPLEFGMFFHFIALLGVTMVAAPGVPGGAVMAALGFLVVTMAISFLSGGDYEEAVAEEARYCQRVDLGVHRDFNENINCKKESNNEH
jgi:Na+/H+-dicarboxylate symporter